MVGFFIFFTFLFQHDEASEECSPGEFGDSNGNYIMFASATDGSKSNNQQVN